MAQQLSGLSLRDLDYALAVAELRHFGRAAERCGVSQPGLSEQIRKLEALLGTVLFERGRGGVIPTPQGEVLLRQIAVVVRESRDLLEMAKSRSGALDGQLMLGVVPTLGPYYVPLVLRDLRRTLPNLVLRLQESQTLILIEALSRFALDLALLALPLETSAEAFATAPIFFEPFRVLLPTGHRLADAPKVALRQLDGQELLLLEEGHCLRDQAISLCKPPVLSRGSEPPRTATSLEMLRHMVAAGEGVSLMPALAAREVSELNGLVQMRPLASSDAGRTIGLAWRATDPRGDDFERLASILRDHAPKGTQPARQAIARKSLA